MTLLPSSIKYGKITGKFLKIIGDGIDPNRYPDGIPDTELTITFRLSATRLKSLAEKSFFYPEEIVATTDASGVMVDGDNQSGVYLVATDQDHEIINPVGATYAVTIRRGRTVLETFSISVPSDSEQDLAEIAPVNASGGTIIVSGPRGLQGEPGPKGDNGTASPEDIAAALGDEGSVARATLNDAYGPRGQNLSRFINRARQGEALKITCLGDSIFEALTASVPATTGIMPLLRDAIAARFGITVTHTNRALSGYTVAMSHIAGNVTNALADEADLYFIAFGGNDIVADMHAGPVPGYPQAASVGALERIIRLIRERVPRADIAVVANNPQRPIDNPANPHRLAHHKAAARVAAVYGCEYIDVESVWLAYPTYGAEWMADGSHPNDAGYEVYRDVIMAHLPNRERSSLSPAQPAAKGLYPVERVNTSAGNRQGYCQVFTPGTTNFAGGPSVTWTLTGTWTAETSPANHRRTSTPGDWFEIAFTGTEAFAYLNNTAAKAPVVDIAVDGVTVYEDWDLSQANPGTRYVPLAVGLADAAHVVRVTLVSGTLDVYNVVALAGASATAGFSPIAYHKDLVANAGAYLDASSGSEIELLTGATTGTMPSDWGSQILTFTGSVGVRVSAVTTTRRDVSLTLRVGGVIRTTMNVRIPPVTEANGYHATIPVAFSRVATVGEAVRLTAQVTSADKAGIHITGHWLQVTAVRAI